MARGGAAVDGGEGPGRRCRAGRAALATLLLARLCNAGGGLGNASSPPTASGSAGGIGYKFFGHSYASDIDELYETATLGIGVAMEAWQEEFHGREGWAMVEGLISYAWWLNQESVLVLDGKRTPIDVFVAEIPEIGNESVEWAANLNMFMGQKVLLGPIDEHMFDRVASIYSSPWSLIFSAGNVLRSSLQRANNNGNAFSLHTPPEHSWKVALRTLKEAGAFSVAVFTEDSDYQRQVCSKVRTMIEEHDLVFVQETTLPADASKDLLGQALEVSGSRDVDVILGCLSKPMCQRLMHQAYLLGRNVPAYLLGDCAVTRDFVHTGRNAYVDYVLGGVHWVPEFPLEEDYGSGDDFWNPGKLRQIWIASHGQNEVPHYAAVGFQLGYLIARAFAAAGTLNITEVARVLRSMDEDSPIGRIAFDADGYRNDSSLLVQLYKDSTGDYRNHRIDAASKLRYPRPDFSMMPCLHMPTMLSFINGHGVNPVTGICEECPEDKLMMWDTRLEHNVCNYCSPGAEPFQIQGSIGGFRDDGPPQFICMPCPSGWYSSIGAVCLMCPRGTFSDNSSHTSCELCPSGKFAANTGSTFCNVCGEDGFSPGAEWYSTENGSSSCDQCKMGGHCPADGNGLHTSMTNRDGFFLMEENTNVEVYRCRHGNRGDACLQGGRCFVDPATGEESMTGPFCGICKPGYGRASASGYCTRCPSQFLSMLYGVVMVWILMAMALGMTVLVVLTDFSKPKNQVAIILKIAWSYVQISSSLLPFITFWEFSVFYALGQGLSGSLNYFNSFTVPNFSIHGASCVASAYFPDVKEWQVRTIVGLVFIPLWMFVVLILWGVFCFWRRLQRQDLPTKDTFVSILVVNLFIIHPKANESLLEIFKCEKFDTMRMLQDTSVICNSDEHARWAAINLMGLLVYSLGIPLGLFCLLFYHKRNGHLREGRIVRSLGFMYAGFEPSCYYFECVLMIRRILFPIAAAVPQTIGISGVLMAASESAVSVTHSEALWDLGTVMGLLALNVLFLALHMALQPFDNRSYFILDRIEESSLWSCLSLSLSQAFSVASSSGQVVASVCCFIVFVINIRFLVLLAWGLGLRKWAQRYATQHDFHFMKPPVVIVEETGLKFRNVKDNAIAKQSLASIFSDIAEHFIDTETLSYRSMVSALQRLGLICVQMQHQERSRVSRSILSLTTTWLQRGVDRGLLSERVAQTMTKGINSSERFLSNWRAKRRAKRRKPSSTMSFESADTVQDDCEDGTGYGGRESGRLLSRLQKSFGRAHTVEDFHRALLIAMKRTNESGVLSYDFGDDALARALGTPTHQDVADKRRKTEAMKREEENRNLMVLGGPRGAFNVQTLQSVFTDSADLRAERREMKEKVEHLERERHRLQAKLHRLSEQSGMELSSDSSSSACSSRGEWAESSEEGSPRKAAQAKLSLRRSLSRLSPNEEEFCNLMDAAQAAEHAEDARKGASSCQRKLEASKKKKKRSKSSKRLERGSTGAGASLSRSSTKEVRISVDGEEASPPRRQSQSSTEAEGASPSEGAVPNEEASPADVRASASRRAANEGGETGEEATPSSSNATAQAQKELLSGLESDINGYCQTFFNGALGSLLPSRPQPASGSRAEVVD